MKKSDIAMIVLIAGLSMLIAFTIGNNIPVKKLTKRLRPGEIAVIDSRNCRNTCRKDCIRLC